MNDEKQPYLWVKLDLQIDPYTKEIFITGGDREPCSHGHPPCCDTEFIGVRLIRERLAEGKEF